MTTKEQARVYIQRGWSVIPVPRGKKGPVTDSWEDLRVKPEQVEEFFVGESNIGVLLGEPSGGLADVDLDCDEALYTGPALLPKTLTSGRSSKVTHYWYTSPGIKCQKFKDVDGEMIAEIRADGLQTVVAPSVHPSGEKIEWKNTAEPLQIDRYDLLSAVARVAVSALIARHLPDGGRHDLALGYAALMLKPLMDLGEDKDEAIDYVHSILEAAWTYHNADHEAHKDLYSLIEDTADKIEADEPAKGRAFIEESLTHGAEIVQRIKNWLGWSYLTPEQREQAEQRRRFRRAKKAEPLCADLATTPDVLQALYDRVAESGLLGEEENAKLLILAAVSLVRGKPISAIIKGTSAVGKSEIIKAVSRMPPPEMLVERQSMSSQSLVYMGENGQLKNKLLVVYELGGFGQEGSEGLEQAKQLLSEGRISRQTVDRDEKNRNTSRAIVTEGPTAMWTTTTRVKTDYELSTRVLELTPDDGQQQTGRINGKAFDYGGEESETDFEDCHALFTWLLGQDNRVYFPHGKALGTMIPSSAVKMRRESPRIRMLIDAHATLHQTSRKRDEGGRIVATLDDYSAVRELVEPFVGAASEQGAKPQTRETVEAALKLLDSEDFDEPGVTIKDLQPLLKIDNSATYRRVQAAYPYLVPLDDKRGRAKQYTKGDDLPAISNVLPFPDELCKFASESTPEGTGTKNAPTNFASGEKKRVNFVQSSPVTRVTGEQKPFNNGKFADTDTTERHDRARPSIGLQSCKVREDEPAESSTLSKDGRILAYTTTPVSWAIETALEILEPDGDPFDAIFESGLLAEYTFTDEDVSEAVAHLRILSGQTRR
jgi:hypothetical protein